MQWEHQIRPPGLSHGMAIAFSKEALRTLQNPLSLYQTIPSSDATDSADSSISPEGLGTCGERILHVVSRDARCICLAFLVTMVDAFRVVGSFLDRRWRMGLQRSCAAALVKWSVRSTVGGWLNVESQLIFTANPYSTFQYLLAGRRPTSSSSFAEASSNIEALIYPNG